MLAANQRMIGSLTLALLLALPLTQAAKPELVAVFLGPIPNAEGFVTAPSRLDDSYKDLRDEFRKGRPFQQVIRLVETRDEAQLVVEVSDRGRVDVGMRAGTATTNGSTTTGMSAPMLKKQLFARLAVTGSDYRLEIDGAAGLKLVTFRNQAKNVLQQIVDWVKANRAKLVAK
jgi:hypothetical protein